jgi:LCP family protein required for cell wall assembly
VVALLAAAVGAFLLVGDPTALALQIGVDPDRLLLVGLTVPAAAAVWAAIVVLTHTSLRSGASLSSGQRVAATLLVSTLLAALAVPPYAVTSYSLIHRDLLTSVFGTDRQAGANAPDAAKPDPWASIPRVTVLLIGADSGRGRIGTRADTLIVASIDTKTGNTVMFSLPRNLLNVPFKIGTPASQAWPSGFNCGNECMLNGIWTWGESNKHLYPGDKNPGLTATISGVEGALGLDIDYYTMLNLQGFKDFVDAIGGIRIDVERQIPIGGGTSQAGAQLPVYGYIEPGKNRRLDGFNALWYARSREGSDDYDRMRRQRCVIGAVIDQADPIEVAKAYPRLAKSAKRNIATDIPLPDLQAWVELTMRVKGASVRSLPFTSSVINTGAPDYPLIHRLVNKALRANSQAAVGPTPSPDPTATAGTGKKKRSPQATPSATANPNVAQDVKQVC